MKIISPDKELLDSFVIQNKGNFQQSWDWIQMYDRQGLSVMRWMVYDEGEPLLAACFIRLPLRAGKHYWLCPGGPTFSNQQNKKALAVLIEKIKSELDGVFVRFDSLQEDQNSEIWKNDMLTRAIKNHSPNATQILSLNGRDEEEVLKSMHSKTRYNIRLAERKGVQIRVEDKYLNDFLEVLKKTANRDGFSLHPDQHYRDILSLPNTFLFSALHKNNYTAGAVVIKFGDSMIYLHGASDYRFRRLMSPYLLHWRIIKQAMQDGVGYYDFWGVAPRGGQNHPWQGITRFKENFGGQYVEYAGDYDLILDTFWYRIYRFVKKFI